MTRTVWRILVFVAGLVLILIGVVLVVLPGPLTIPPILLGVWLWALEFEFARRMLRPVQARGAGAWEKAKQATRDAWHRVERALPGDADGDGI